MLELLALKKMSQADLARAIGVSQAFVSYILSGRKKVSFKLSKRLIDLFGAELISHVIDWNAMKINNLFGETR